MALSKIWILFPQVTEWGCTFLFRPDGLLPRCGSASAPNDKARWKALGLHGGPQNCREGMQALAASRKDPENLKPVNGLPHFVALPHLLSCSPLIHLVF